MTSLIEFILFPAGAAVGMFAMWFPYSEVKQYLRWEREHSRRWRDRCFKYAEALDKAGIHVEP